MLCFDKWKGSGGLKACPGTTEEDSKVNLELCNTILQDPDIKALHGVYKVEGAGQVTLDKTKGRKHISNIMCSSRKPSAYQKQCSKDSSRKRACRGKAEESNDNVPMKVQKGDLQTEAKNQFNDSGIIDEEEGTCNNESEVQTIKVDKLRMLESGFVDGDQAIIVALHYLRAKKLSEVTLKKLKPFLKRYCVPCMKDSAKDDLLRSLGRVLFERKVVKRKDESEVITHNNLKTVQ